MKPHISAVTADMSHLMWRAKVEGLCGTEIQQRYFALREHHLKCQDGSTRDEVAAELELWGERIASLLNPAFLEQAI